MLVNGKSVANFDFLSIYLCNSKFSFRLTIPQVNL
jgi:hypothetical protein